MLSNVVVYILSVLDFYQSSVCLCEDAMLAELDIKVGDYTISFLFSQDEVAAIHKACIDANVAERSYLKRASYVASRLLDVFNPYEAE